MQLANISIRNVSPVRIVTNYLAIAHSFWKMVVHIVKWIGTNYLQRNASHADSQLKLAIAGLKPYHTIITVRASIAP